jgi:hypothetical protein
LFEKANPVHLGFEDRDGVVRYRGRHTGYERFEHPVAHERAFAFTKATGALRIEDQLSGAGHHRFQWRFHGAPGVTFYPAQKGRVRIEAGAVTLNLSYDPRLGLKVVPAWYAPSYGARVGCNALELTLDADLAAPLAVAFAIQPA